MDNDSRNTGPRAKPLPNALLVWDNQARRSLSPGTLVWLSVLVITSLCSALFVRDHLPARWVLGGFFLSHAIVWGLAATTQFIIRRGFVSLAHIACWAPGWIVVILDAWGHSINTPYAIWSIALIVVISISFVFDLRDALTYLYCLAKGKIPV